jgi:hypothetical protein
MILRTALCLLVAASALRAQTPEPRGFALDEADRKLVVIALATLDRPQIDPEAEYEALHGAAHRACALLGPHSRHGARITATLAELATTGDLQPARRNARLRELLEACRRALSFLPTEEADRPVGFPGFTTVGELEVKHYPAHRLARTAMPSLLGETRGFWTLFQHIKSNEIAMTAPVEMRYDQDGGLKPLTMAFLYGDMAIGKTGREGDVEVVDIEPMTVISLGFRGLDRDERVKAAGTELEAWLKRNAKSWERAGELRVMGWNGPGVRGQKRYFEVQLPVRAKKDV